MDNSELARPGTPGYHKLGKIRPLITLLVNKFEYMYRLQKNVSVDEAMIRFKGRSTLKQYIPNKPIKRGIEVWVLADAENGYIACLVIYKGKQGGNSEGAKVVKILCQNIKHK